MNKFSILLVYTLIVISVGCQKSETKSNGYTSDEDIVYICTGPMAEVYHLADDCEGLNNCSGDIEEISLWEVKDERRPCKICAE